MSSASPLSAGRITLLAALLLVPALAISAPAIPALSLVDSSDGGKTWSVSIQILLMMTALTLLPSLLLAATSFTRIVIVLAILRQALGMPQTPPNQILIGLSLFLTFVIMSPVFTDINQHALQPYLQHEIPQGEAFHRAEGPLKAFMLKQVREKDVGLFLELTNRDAPATPEELPLLVVIPSFVIGELKTAFQMGFVLFIPFLVIDMVVASVLMSMGMMMLPPVVISLPFKLIFFVLVDGWRMLAGSLVESFMSGPPPS